MNAHRRALAPALAALLATLGPHAISATERACAAPSVEADDSFVTRFPELLERLRSDIARPDIDACARIDLRAADGEVILVSVTLPDGRATTRAADRHEDILPALQALLLVPQTPAARATPARPRSAAPARPASRAALLGPAAGDRGTSLTASAEPRTLGFELSLVAGPRMGEGQLAIGLGALSLLEVHGWLFGFQGRTDRYQTLLDSDPQLALELAALAGKRFHFERFALDLNAGPAVAMKGLALSNTEVARVNPETMPPRLPEEEPSTGPVPRLLLSARAGFSPRSVLRSFAGLEASLGPARGDENPNPSSAHFPVFTLGLVLGGTVGTP